MMYLTSLLVIVLPALSIYARKTTLSDVKQAFTDFDVVPDVLPSFYPTALLDVVFTDPTTNQPLNVTPGLNLTMTQTRREPQFALTFNGTSRNRLFVLAILDPDAPTPQNPNNSQFRHMLAGDLKLNDTDGNGNLLVNSSAALTEFANPTPPSGSDPHRYVALLYNQPYNFSTIAPHFVNQSTFRANFNITTFSHEVGLGSPIAGTFFLTGPDESSDTTTFPISSGPMGRPFHPQTVPTALEQQVLSPGKA